MPLNPYFINGTSSEQRLIQDLVNEQIKMFGQEVVYMPRKFITDKKIIKEILVSKFDDSFYLEAYISTPDGFGGQDDILSKFGVRSTDEITFIISKERFEDFITPYIQDQDDIKISNRPQEGDLIYFPLDNGLFEVKYVAGKRPFYQLNNLYVYELKCELFEYEDEIISTSLTEVDENIKDFGYIITLDMGPTGVNNAIASIELANNLYYEPVGKSISRIEIINGGFGYKSTPEIIISPPDGDGVRAEAIALLNTKGNSTTIDKILIKNPGIGYISEPKIKLKTTSGSGFSARVVLSNNSLGPIQIINSGNGYSVPPTVSISTSPTGDNAEAVAILSSSGKISEILYVNSGSGYTETPTINISQPSGITTGNYIFNEVVRGESTGTTAFVKDWDINTRILKLSIIDGKFTLGENVIGVGATYRIFSIDTDNIYDPYSSNKDIQEKSNSILDFSETNPFGEF